MEVLSGFYCKQDDFFVKVYSSYISYIINMKTGDIENNEDFDIEDENGISTLKGGLYAYLYSDTLYIRGRALTKADYRRARILFNLVCNYIEQEFPGYLDLCNSLKSHFNITVFSDRCKITPVEDVDLYLIKLWKDFY